MHSEKPSGPTSTEEPTKSEAARLYEIARQDAELQHKVLDALERAELKQRTLDQLCERQAWQEKVINSLYTITCDISRSLNSLLEILGGRLRKDSDKLDLLQTELEERALRNGMRDLLKINAGGDVQVDQSLKLKGTEESED